MQNQQSVNSASAVNNQQSSALKKLFNLEFVLSILVPIVLFYIFSKMGGTLQGTIAAGVWSILMTVVVFVKDRKLNVYAIIGLIFSVVGLAATVTSNNPVYYLASPIVSDILFAIAFLGSVAIKKPLIQAFAEYQMKDMFSPALRAKPMYKNAWIILTVAWGLLSLLQAGIRIVLLMSVSSSVYFSASTVIGNTTSIIMLIASVRFPSWYWKRGRLKEAAVSEAGI